MNYSELFASLLPKGPYDTNAPVLSTFIDAIGARLDVQAANGKSILDNIIPGTADINGIDIWEKILDLPSDPSLTLAQRQQRCAAMAIRTPGVLGYSNLLAILNSFSKLKRAQIIEDPATYSLVCIVAVGAEEMSDYQQIVRTVYRFLPAHLSCEIHINYIHMLNMGVGFSFWPSEVIAKCGTLQSGGEAWEATEGRTIKHLMQLMKESWNSSILPVAAESLMPVWTSGLSHETGLQLSTMAWPGEVLLRSSPGQMLMLSDQGRTLDEQLSQSTMVFYSTPFVSCGTAAAGEEVMA